MHELGYAAEYRHLPHYGGEPFAGDTYAQMSFRVLSDIHFRGVEAESFQECEIPQRQIDTVLYHIFHFLVSNGDVLHVFDLLAKKPVESGRIYLAVAVIESVLHFGSRVGLKDIVLTGECIEVVVCKMLDNRFHNMIFHKITKILQFLFNIAAGIASIM